MKKEYWRRLSTEALLKHPRITIVEDEVVLPTGTHTKYLRFEGLNDYVTIIATREDKIAMIREYSYPHDEWLYQFPEGVIDAGETPDDGANRELLEETGFTAEHIKKIGINYDHHRRNTTINHIFLATGISEGSKAAGDEEEHGTETYWFTTDEIKAMLRDGKIVQKNAQAALALYFVAQQ
jgi:8-oxo-dGTP pyrophosphatase MutT (NUDIX family)